MVKEELAEKVLEVRRKSVRVIVVVMVIGQVTVRVISGICSATEQEGIGEGF